MAHFFTTFNFKEKEEVSSVLNSLNEEFVTPKILEDLLSTRNVNFVLSNINRLQSTLLCELGLSYVQQSQRYVPISNSSIYITEDTPVDLYYEFKGLIERSIDLYKRMTELNDPNKTGRLNKEDFKHGIMYEDARAIIPLCLKTTMSVTCTADKLLELAALFTKYKFIFKDLILDMYDAIDDMRLSYFISKAANMYVETDVNILHNQYKKTYNKLNNENNVIILDIDDIETQVAIGALASQNAESPDAVFDSWGIDAIEKGNKMINRVLSYGHYGILEHARSRFAMQCSLSTYHQVIRHRHQNLRREPLYDIIIDDKRDFTIPDNIKNNEEFYHQVIALIEQYRDTWNKLSTKYDAQLISQFLLNCTDIKFINSSNIRNDFWIFRERLCYTAQKEIRDLYLKKYDIMYNHCPEIMKDALPPCVITGKCKEGKLTCGQANTVIEQYSKYRV